jgi:hypothetical protein
MLQRPPARRRQRNDKRERRRLAERDYRRRFKAGKFTVAVEIDDRVVDMMLAPVWLKSGEISDKLTTADDRKKIGAAIASMLAEAAKR